MKAPTQDLSKFSHEDLLQFAKDSQSNNEYQQSVIDEHITKSHIIQVENGHLKSHLKHIVDTGPIFFPAIARAKKLLMELEG